MGKKCSGNTRLIAVASTAFAGPLLSLTGTEGGGIQLFGLTSRGKTTAQIVGGSVCGGGGKHGFVQSWRTTTNALEPIAEAHNDSTLFLDEISQADPNKVTETAYMLGNGMGKNRATPGMALRKQLKFTLLYVSSGEMTLSEHAASVGKRTRGGAEVRLLNIEADAGKGFGLFENLHGEADGDKFAQKMEAAALSNYGAPYRVFVKLLVRNRRGLKRYFGKVRKIFFDDCVPDDADGEVRRAANRFSLIATAGELATWWELTGWEEGEAIDAAERCFLDWLKNRGTHGSSDIEGAIRQIRGLLQANGMSRFPLIQRGGGVKGDQVVREQAGFRRQADDGKTEFLIFTEGFKNEFCKGYSWRAVLKELLKRGYLRRGGPNMTIKDQRVPGFKDPPRLYCVREAILKGDES